MKYQISGKKILFLLIIGVYITISLLTLTRFPLVHSDEAWLSGLSRNILENKSFSVTEGFFDLKERHPHAIKILFHTLQIGFIKLMGYHIFTFRFLSFCFGLLSLFFIYKLSKSIFVSEAGAWLVTAFTAMDVQFIYASHFARQEIIILFALILGLWYKFEVAKGSSLRHEAVLGSIIGLSIGIHPNSFIISLPFGVIYLYEIFFLKKKKIISLIVLIAVVLCFAAVFVGISLHFDPNFFHNYAKYGSEFEVFNPIGSKIAEVGLFYQKLYFGVSGTYYTPNIKLQLLLFAAVLLISIIRLLKTPPDRELKHKIIAVILALAAINAGIIMIGRFNQTSIVLIFPLFYILTVYCLQGLPPYASKIFSIGLAMALLLFTCQNFGLYRDNSYGNYLSEISAVVPSSAKTLGNLNAEYAFDNGSLLDYRNLAYMKQNGMSFEEYIRKNRIEYILCSEELDLIYQLRPKWDGIYGSMGYYEDMQAFIKEKCHLVRSFTDRYYGIRIFRYIGLKDWQVKIYKVVY